MLSKRFEINWIYVAVAIVLSGGGLGFIGWIFTTQILAQMGRNNSPILDWIVIILIDSVCVLSFLAAMWKIYCDYRTEVSKDAITRPSLFGERKIKWSDVTDVRIFNGAGIHIHGANDRIVISPYVYKKPNFVVEELRKLLESTQKV